MTTLLHGRSDDKFDKKLIERLKAQISFEETLAMETLLRIAVKFRKKTDNPSILRMFFHHEQIHLLLHQYIRVS